MDQLGEYSAYDKARRPYTVIDTYSPNGTWIEEKRFNRSNYARENNEGSAHRRVLYGNWQEEEALGEEKAKGEGGKEEKPRVKGGFISSPLITCDARHPELRVFETTSRSDYTAQNGDIRSLRRPEFGVRKQLLLKQALSTAMEETKRKMEEANAAYEAAMRDTESGRGKMPLPVIETLRQDYLSDEPITLYTGIPDSTKVMMVHGKTPVDPMRASRFGKHTYFSDPKYHL
ncbi:unnamed protein product [Phytomonas sp. EM1]|nr:unnamed protein product [Phytomonas sp. EM1]|eukprot:CCW64827.1 unnamed protein product [Phytomonas sp. isolate EM1]